MSTSKTPASKSSSKKSSTKTDAARAQREANASSSAVPAKLPPMPAAEPTIEQLEEADVVADDAEIARAQKAFGPAPAEVDGDEGSDIDEDDEDDVESFFDDATPTAPVAVPASPPDPATRVDLPAPASGKGPKVVRTSKEALADYHRQVKELGPVHVKALSARKAALRLNRLLHGTKDWGSCMVNGVDVIALALQGVATAQVALRAAADRLQTVPRDWRPSPAPEAASSAPETAADLVGKKVSIREKHAASYKDILEGDELKGLTVITAIGGKVRCKTVKDETVILPRGHVTID